MTHGSKEPTLSTTPTQKVPNPEITALGWHTRCLQRLRGHHWLHSLGPVPSEGSICLVGEQLWPESPHHAVNCSSQVLLKALGSFFGNSIPCCSLHLFPLYFSIIPIILAFVHTLLVLLVNCVMCVSCLPLRELICCC